MVSFAFSRAPMLAVGAAIANAIGIEKRPFNPRCAISRRTFKQSADNLSEPFIDFKQTYRGMSQCIGAGFGAGSGVQIGKRNHIAQLRTV